MDDSLVKLENKILRKMILDNPNRPDKYKFNEIYRLFDYLVYREEEVKAALDSLVIKEIIVFENEFYSLERSNFIYLKRKYRVTIFLNSRQNMMIIPILAATITAITTMIPETTNFFLKDSYSEQLEVKNKIENKINILNKQLEDFYSKTPKEASYSNGAIAIEIKKIKNQYSQLSENVKSLNSLLDENPRKFVEISSMKKDIDDLKKEIGNNDEAIKREVDRISSYNNTLIAFMITFLVAYVGIGVFNLINKNNNPTI